MSGAATAPRTGWATGADAALRASGIALAALAWEAFARARPSTFFPPLSRTLATLGRMALDGSLPSHLLVSSFRGIAGFALAIALGVPLGLLLGHGAPRAHAVLEPALRVASQVNPFALLSVFLLVFGGGETVKIAAVAWVALWPILFCTVSGAAAVDPALVKGARALCASPSTIAWGVVLPAAGPAVFAGLRLGTGLVFFVLVAAEMLGATRGLGWLVHSSAMNYQIPGIYAGALAVVLLGTALHAGVRALEERLFPRLGPDDAGGAVQPRVLATRGLSPGAAAALAALLAAFLVAGWVETRRVLAHDQGVMRSAPAAEAR